MTIKLDFQTVKNIKTPGRYTDALLKGLHVWVKPSLNKYWIFRYAHKGKRGYAENISRNYPDETDTLQCDYCGRGGRV